VQFLSFSIDTCCEKNGPCGVNFEGIRAAKRLNNCQYMADTTMLAIMGRMATCTGQEIT